MGQRVVLVDDIDGTVDGTVETVEFALHGFVYQIDLKQTNHAHLSDVLDPFIQHARLIERPKQKRAPLADEGRSHED